MSGFFGTEPADLAATWVAAIVTLVVLGGLLGERRVFGWSQHLFAGLITGFLVLLAISEVIVPRLVEPLIGAPGGRLDLWLGAVLVGLGAGAPWLPRPIAAVPISIALGALAAFALGGAVIGTLLPQLGAAIAAPAPTPAGTLAGIVAAIISGLVLIGFVHGVPRGRTIGLAAGAGRWLLIAGLGGWLGYLLFARLILLTDRIGFLLGDWLGLGR